MAHLLALPQELCQQIFSLVELDDKVRLSTTCKTYRAHFAPEIFNTLRLTNKESIASSALAAVEIYGQYTTRIDFTCHCGPDTEVTSPALPLAASKVLHGHLTTNLRTISVKFAFDLDDGYQWDDYSGQSIYLFDGLDSEDHVREMEPKWQWRALMKETWQAIAENMRVRELIIDDFIPKPTSTFGTDQFRQFLSRLESFTLDILGMDNGAGWKTNTTEGYIDFLRDLDTLFFHYMTDLKYLDIKAKDPLGLEGFRHIPLALKPDDLPSLESLRLKDCFVGPELVSFIRGHRQVLKSLDVKGCVSAGDGAGMAENPIYWAEFFDQVYEAKPALTELIAGGGKAPLTRDEEFDRDYQYKDEPEEVQEIRRKLTEDPKLHLFGYSYLDSKYGMFFMEEEENVRQFNAGNDQRAYDRLMGLVNENATKLKQVGTAV